MTGPPSCYTNTATDRSQIRAKLDAALASSPRGPRPGSPARGPAPAPATMAPGAMAPSQQEQIYAPVAALQQKIQQQQQVRLAHGHAEPGSVPHPPGPQVCPQQQQQQYCQQQQSYQQQYGGGQKYCQQQSHPYPTQKQQQQSNGSPEGEQYGFGMQFQMHSKSFYSRQQGQQQHHPTQQQLQQQQLHMHMQQQQHQQFAYHHHHDQIMSDMDPMLAQRPQPPDINGHVPAAVANGAAYWPAGGQYGGGGAHNGMGHCDAQSALRVRQWIETRTVSDVRKVRPILNQEIQRGLSLRKTAAVSDRSQPHF
jgi:hypothetical protein